MRVSRPGIFAVIVLLALAGCSHGAESGNPEQSPAPARTPMPAPAPTRAAALPESRAHPGAHGNCDTPSRSERVAGIAGTHGDADPRENGPAPLAQCGTGDLGRSGQRDDGLSRRQRLWQRRYELQRRQRRGENRRLRNEPAQDRRGRFELTYKIGALPWFVRGNFTLQVIARNARGDAVSRSIPLTVR